RYDEAITFCSSNPAKPCYGGGDLNARTKSKSPENSPFMRSSIDATSTTRGNRLLELWGDCRMSILNGSPYDTAGCAVWTSYQAMGKSVIDYMFALNSGLQFVKSFTVQPKNGWSDHCATTLRLDI
ncbi:hypothetical protein DFH07DRAFT_688408, partial [Mycena maculata]